MDIYEQIVSYFSGIHGMHLWEEVQALFRRIASYKPQHWLLPAWACEAVGGTPDQAISAMVAIACSHISVILVDDMLDSDPRGEYHRIGAPAAANLACAFQAAGLEAIAHCEIELGTRLTALDSLNQMILTTTLGQHLDVQGVADEASYWRVVRTKSSPFFGTALHIGALLGGGSVEIAWQLNETGRLYGEMIQIHDDMNDAMDVPANSDWISGRSSLPILFAQIVEHPDRQRFLALRQEAFDPEKLAEAQAILIRCGAISYGIDQLIRRYQKCRKLLHDTPLRKGEVLEAMFDEVIHPIKELLSALEMT